MSKTPFLSALSLIPLALLATTGCTKLKKGKDSDAIVSPAHPVDPKPIEAQKSTLGILDLKVELRSDGMLLRVANLPEGATLDCDRDNQPLVPCHDNALFERPKEGDHKITAVALKDGVPVAFGESAVFTVLPGTGGILDSDGDPRNPLTLTVDDAAFVNGAAVPLATNFKARFKLFGEPGCKAELRCKYDSRTSPFWSDCDAGGKSFTVPSALMALGVQYLSVQASCPDKVGPIMTLYWYGVPDGYKPLMLKDSADPNGRHLVELVRDLDCAEGVDAKFECAARGSADFERCDGNIFDNPASGYRVRYKCGDATGPELVFP